MAPQRSEITQLVTSTESKVDSLKAAIFHTMAYKMSLEINKGNITLSPDVHSSKFYIMSAKQRKKHISFEQ